MTALEDQSLAGLIMWVPGSIVYLVPAFVFMGARGVGRAADTSPRDSSKKQAPRELVQILVTRAQSAENRAMGDVAAGGGRDGGWLSRHAGSGAKYGGRSAVDSLARAFGAGSIGCGKRVLHGVPVYAWRATSPGACCPQNCAGRVF